MLGSWLTIQELKFVVNGLTNNNQTLNTVSLNVILRFCNAFFGICHKILTCMLSEKQNVVYKKLTRMTDCCRDGLLLTTRVVFKGKIKHYCWGLWENDKYHRISFWTGLHVCFSSLSKLSQCDFWTKLLPTKSLLWHGCSRSKYAINYK